jgi:hypothetical protein
MSTVNVLANKPFITTQLNSALSGAYYMPALSGITVNSNTVSYLGNTGNTNTVSITTLPSPPPGGYLQNGGATITGLSTTALPLGTLLLKSDGTKLGAIIGYTSGATFDASGNSASASTFSYVLDQLVAINTPFSSVSVTGFGTSIANGVTLQNALQNVLNNPIPSIDLSGNVQYYQFITILISVLNGINNNNPTSATGSGPGATAVRILCAMDDGTPICDTGKCAYNAGTNSQIIGLMSSLTNAVGNTYVNFIKKLTISCPLYNTTNATVADVSGCIFTVGTAGGNAINENHQTRPEILLALFSNNGIGYAQRWSSSTRTNNLYIAQRIGVAPEANQGTIRLNVPISF